MNMQDAFGHMIDQNHPMGCFEAGNRCCLDNLVNSYDEEGIVIFNHPKSFDWEAMGDAAAVCIEKISICGSRARSLKYEGKK